MAPPARRKKQNHKLMVKVLVPPKVPATTYDVESYQEWMRMRMRMPMMKEKKKTRKGQNLELSDFPDDLIESILERLSSADRIRFGATCNRNLSVVTTTQQQHPYQFRTIDKLPWLATFFYGSVDLVFRLFEPLHQRGQPNYADYQIRDTKGEWLGRLSHTTIKACKKGWFLCLWPKGGEEEEEEEEEEGMTCFLLFCPFNKRIIKLPDLDHDFDLWSCQATFSSDDPSSPDCVFFFLSQNGTLYDSISTLDQKSQKWKTKLFGRLVGYVSSVVYHEGCFYCLSIQGKLAAYDVVHHNWSLIIAPSPLSNLYFRMPMMLFSIQLLSLVACEGKLIIAFVGVTNSEYNNLQVFRCGLFEFSSSTSTWVEKTSLGDHALFLGLPTAFTVRVPSWSNVADRMYFYSSRMEKACPIYYSFKDGRCHLSEDGGYWSSDVKYGMWIEPPSPPKQGSTHTPNS